MARKLCLKWCGGNLEAKKTFPEIITRKIFETNSSFHVK